MTTTMLLHSAGQPVSISFIGGSITEGGGVPVHDRPPLSFAGKVSNWFINTFPNSTVTVQNAGVGGVTSTYYGQCVDMFVSDENVDLVFVDFTLNDRASGVRGKSPLPDTPDRSAFPSLPPPPPAPSPSLPSVVLPFCSSMPCPVLGFWGLLVFVCVVALITWTGYIFRLLIVCANLVLFGCNWLYARCSLCCKIV